MKKSKRKETPATPEARESEEEGNSSESLPSHQNGLSSPPTVQMDPPRPVDLWMVVGSNLWVHGHLLAITCMYCNCFLTETQLFCTRHQSRSKKKEKKRHVCLLRFTDVQYSDIRLKTSIEDLAGAVSTIQLLSGKKYRWKGEKTNLDNSSTEGARKTIGLIAQEVEKTVPSAVTETSDGFANKKKKKKKKKKASAYFFSLLQLADS